MKIKIGDKIYDAKDEPIMVILEGNDKENIKKMHPMATKYCSFPEEFSSDQIKEFMKT